MARGIGYASVDDRGASDGLESPGVEDRGPSDEPGLRLRVSARAGSRGFDGAVCRSCNRLGVLYTGVAALLDTLARIEDELAELDNSS